LYNYFFPVSVRHRRLLPGRHLRRRPVRLGSRATSGRRTGRGRPRPSCGHRIQFAVRGQELQRHRSRTRRRPVRGRRRIPSARTHLRTRRIRLPESTGPRLLVLSFQRRSGVQRIANGRDILVR